jgi:hypothetical protein
MSAVATTIAARGRARAQGLLSRAGERAAELDARPGTHRLLLKVLPQVLARRFDAAAAGDLEAVMELRISDPEGGAAAAYELAIAGGACRITPGPARNPGAGAEVRGDDLIRLAAGSVGWPELLAAKRLSMSGDVFLALRFPILFKLPA